MYVAKLMNGSMGFSEIDNSYDYATYNAMKKVYTGNENLENIIPRSKEILMREKKETKM